ncbi:hypothetical protein E8E14_002509 [Neopestalotiopsis sp. 37M]|nr:hypothetical protein E8E14_002509 [Neopestalotiopsis sp. 37M]
MTMSLVIQALQQTYNGQQLHLAPATTDSTLGSGPESVPAVQCTVLPTNTQDVSNFLRTIRPFVLSGNATFAVRDGGASEPPSDEEVGQDVIVLDLANLQGVDLLPDGTVSISTGEKWDTVYEQLAALNMTVAGARNGGRGIGHLALQGGLSFFSSSRGFVSDNVKNYEVVLASGEVVNASEHENPDLWSSLKGGSNNFGIVTRYDMAGITQNTNMWGGFVYYYADSWPGQMEALVGSLENCTTTNSNTHIILSLVYAAAFGSLLGVNRVYQTDGAEAPPELKPFTSMSPQIEGYGSLGHISVQAAASTTPGGSRRVHMDTTTKADVQTLLGTTDIFKTALESIKSANVNILSAQLTIEPLPVSLLEKSVSKSGPIFGVQPADGPLISITLGSSWSLKSDDDPIVDTFKGALQKIKQMAESRGTAMGLEPMSTAMHFQDPIASYGAGNKQMMQETSQKYDPEGLFRKGLVADFKLNRSLTRAFRTQVTPLPLPTTDFTGKTVIVTGANTGLGKAAAQHFLRLKAAKVILACRSVAKGEEAKAEIERVEGHAAGSAEVWQVDMGSFESVKRFCARANELERLDALVANAGLQTFTYEAYEGYERQTTVHVISTFLMSLLLLPVMRRTMAKFGAQPHQAIVNSNGHMYTKFEARLGEDSVFGAVKGDKNMRYRYYDTKLMQVFVARELAARLKASGKPLVVLNIVDPGYCQSDLLRTNEWELPIRIMMAIAYRTLARTADMGARNYVMAASAGPESHGLYLEDCGFSTPNPIVETEEGRELQGKIFDELVEILDRVQPGIWDNV